MHVTHGGKYCNVLKQAMVKQFVVVFAIFERELVEALCVLSVPHIVLHVCVKVIMLSSPKSFRSQLDLCNIINF